MNALYEKKTWNLEHELLCSAHNKPANSVACD